MESEEDVDSGSRSVKHSTTTATARDNCPSGRVGRGEESGGRTQSRSDGGNVDPRKMAVMKVLVHCLLMFTVVYNCSSETSGKVGCIN